MKTPINKEDLSVWKPYKKGLCNGCWTACCTMPLEMSAMDLIRLGIATEDELMESLPKTAKRLIKEKLVAHYQSKSQIFTLSRTANGDCLYLDKNRLCTVYDKRPEVCRQFPKIGPKPGHCPHAMKGK